MLHRLLMILVLSYAVVSYAQEWEIGVQGGASGYMGDLNPEHPLAFNDWSAGLSAKYNLNHTWGIRANFAYANTYAYDYYSSIEQRRNRWLGFFGAVKEAALLVDFNFFKWLPQRGRMVYTPYIFAGVGGVSFDPQRYIHDPSGGRSYRISLSDFRTEGTAYRTTAITIPFGAGFKYNLRGPWSVGVELGYRLAFTDYLDDVSGAYFDFARFVPSDQPGYTASFWNSIANPSGAPIGSQRGDGRPHDSFMTLGVTLSYTIFKGGCPEWQ